VRDHTFANAAAGETVGLGTTKDAEDVVLRASEAKRLEELFGFEAEEIGGFLEGNKEAVFQGKSEAGIRQATHEATIVVMTTSVKRK
jgi:hypothetical protein